MQVSEAAMAIMVVAAVLPALALAYVLHRAQKQVGDEFVRANSRVSDQNRDLLKTILVLAQTPNQPAPSQLAGAMEYTDKDVLLNRVTQPPPQVQNGEALHDFERQVM